MERCPHIKYFNRHFGYVLRPSVTQAVHDTRLSFLTSLIPLPNPQLPNGNINVTINK